MTNLQYFASEDGFLVTYPARQLDPDFCRTEMYDPRLRPVSRSKMCIATTPIERGTGCYCRTHAFNDTQHATVCVPS